MELGSSRGRVIIPPWTQWSIEMQIKLQNSSNWASSERVLRQCEAKWKGNTPSLRCEEATNLPPNEGWRWKRTILTRPYQFLKTHENSGTTPSCIKKCTQLTLDWHWNYLQRLVLILHPWNMNIYSWMFKAMLFCQSIKITSNGKAGHVVPDFFGLFTKTEQFSAGRLECC